MPCPRDRDLFTIMGAIDIFVCDDNTGLRCNNYPRLRGWCRFLHLEDWAGKGQRKLQGMGDLESEDH